MSDVHLNTPPANILRQKKHIKIY